MSNLYLFQVLLFICGLITYDMNKSANIVSKDRIITDQWIENYVKKGDVVQFKVEFRHLNGVVYKNN